MENKEIEKIILQYRLDSVISKIDIYIENEIISKEMIIKTFTDFLRSSSNKTEHNVGFVLHTGSVCFDACTIVFAAIACLLNNTSSIDEVLSDLQIDDLVIYSQDTGRTRAKFKGFFSANYKPVNSIDKAIYIMIETEQIIGKGKRKGEIIKTTQSLAKHNWERISPYYGKSKLADYHGLKQKNKIRDEFYREIIGGFGSPSVANASCALVMKKEQADYLLKNIQIGFNDKRINLLEIVTASYFTENAESPYGGNAEKAEPILKISSKVSVARKAVVSKRGNKHIGVIILGNEIIKRHITEIPGIMNRKSLPFVYLVSDMDSESIDALVAEIETPNIFACSRDFLLSNTLPIEKENRFTSELKEQTDIIIDKEVISAYFESPLKWEDYKNLKKSILSITRSEFASNEKDEFVISAFVLLNLFTTAVFKLSDMEKCINEGKIDKMSPSESLSKLKELSKSIPSYLFEKSEFIIGKLNELYLELYDNNEKENYLRKELSLNRHRKHKVVVPKAYYATILAECGLFDIPNQKSLLTVVTANSFSRDRDCRKIFVTGNFFGTRFDAFRCTSSRCIETLIYEYEKNMYIRREKAARKSYQILNRMNHGDYSADDLFEEETQYIEEASDKEVNEIAAEDYEIDEYIEKLNDLAYSSMFMSQSFTGSNKATKAIAMGSFEDGEKIFFTKRYKAYAYDEITGIVKELEIEDLEEGMSLVFTQNNSETKDIVDEVLQRLIDKKILNDVVADNYIKSKRWKEKLREYKMIKDLKNREIARRLELFGSSVDYGTVGVWLDEDAHTVGPQKAESIAQIAKLVGDTEMLENVDIYFNACKIIRKIRRGILKNIASAIINKLCNKTPNGNEIEEYIYSRIDSMAVVLRLESIVPVNREIPVNLVNKPITL